MKRVEKEWKWGGGGVWIEWKGKYKGEEMMEGRECKWQRSMTMRRGDKKGVKEEETGDIK